MKTPRFLTIPREHWKRARELRRDSTRAERIFWKALRLRLPNFDFRRQHPIGPYIVDFVCLEHKFVVELDGDVHVQPEQLEHDAVRDEYLRTRGFNVRRYPNPEVLKNLDGVLLDIAEALKD